MKYSLSNKIKLLAFAIPILAGFVLAFSSFVLAAVAPSQTHDFWINVNNSTNINVQRIRVTGATIVLDTAFTNWTFNLRYELWRTNGGDRVIDRGNITTNMAALAALLNAPNPKNALRNAVLADTQLQEKP